DAGHADLYQKNADVYLAKLKKLHEDGNKQLKGVKDVPIITFHESMSYFAESFHLNILGSIRPSGNQEPAPRDIQQLVVKCEKLPPKQKRLVLIAIEPQYDSSKAKIVRDQLEKAGVTRVPLVTLDPLETCAASDLSADWYLNKMQQNLDNLAGSV